MTASPHPLDHLVLPVVDIATARSRLTALGFTVAADARHPFGTENACVFFKDKTYLEPLGVASVEQCEETARDGNQFTARNNAFRFRKGPEGLSAIVMGSQDADADDAGFHKAGISAGEMLQFSRPMKLPDGSEITATFKLSFAADLRAPDFHGITCQRINVPPADRSALERHANGVKSIARVVLAEQAPADFAAFLSEIIGTSGTGGNDAGMTLDSANAAIHVLTAKGLKDQFGLAMPEGRGLTGQAVVFAVENLAETERHFSANGVAYTRSGNLLLVGHAPGQGVLFAFGE